MQKKVMIVDDVAYVRDTMSFYFETPDFKVIASVANGVEAVEQLKEHKPDLITMDIIMPFKSGIDTIRTIRTQDKGVTIVVCSALGHENLVTEAMDAGADGFVVKPFRQDALLKAVRKALEKRAAQN
jgi:two-component system chemotaxis response regulator CheY